MSDSVAHETGLTSLPKALEGIGRLLLRQLRHDLLQQGSGLLVVSRVTSEFYMVTVTVRGLILHQAAYSSYFPSMLQDATKRLDRG